MSNDLALAADYRKHAQELRHVAGETRPLWATVALNKAADDYEAMAGSLERIYAAGDRQADERLNDKSPAVRMVYLTAFRDVECQHEVGKHESGQ